ncbi:MAG: two-CW domain-containing protein [Nitrospirota bacterium]
MKKLNCWEFKKCGRDLGGEYTLDLGICPATTDIIFDGIHDGISAGRACWVIAGTMCNGNTQGTFAGKYKDCGRCDFYNAVRDEEGDNFIPTVVLLKRLKDII